VRGDGRVQRPAMNVARAIAVACADVRCVSAQGRGGLMRKVYGSLVCVLLAACAATPVRDPAASLASLRLDVPCGDHFNNDTECHWDRALLQSADPRWKMKQEIVRTFGGKPGVLYQVTLHVRGVVEPKNFTGGTVQFEHFQAGGEPVKNDYNFYSLAVSD